MNPDKVNLNDLENLKDRDHSFRTVIENKKYDTCHEDDLCRLLVKNERWGSMLLIRYEYYLSKTYHQLGKGDLVFYDSSTGKLYAVELKSLKDKYSSTTDQSKIDKCIDQSLKYALAAQHWSGKRAIPVTVIEYPSGEVVVEERYQQILRPATEHVVKDEANEVPNVWQNIPSIPPGLSVPLENDKWFTHPGDQTQTRYKINGDTLESERIVDKEPSSGSRKSYRQRVKRVAKECTKCTKYYLIMKLSGTNDVVMSEMKSIDDVV